MAQDIFAPKTSFDIGYEKPQQGVTDNTAKIAADFEAMALGAQARAVQGQAQLESNQFRALDMGLKIGAQSYDAYVDSQEKLAVSRLIKEFENIDAQDGEKGLPYETKRARYTNAIGKAGQSMPGGMAKLAKYGAIIKNATGIDMGEVQKDPSQAMYETMLKDPMFYSAFQASKIEQPNLTQEERFLKAQQFAIANAAVQLESTTLDLKSLDSYNKKGKRFVDNIILNTEKYLKGSLQTKIEQGIPITTEDIEQLEPIVKNTQLQVAKIIPPSAPESERNYYDNIFTQIDNLLKEIKDTKDPDLILRGLASGLTQLAQDQDDITGMAAGAMFADLNLLTTADGINTYIESIKKQSDGTYKPSRISGGDADQIMDMITKDYEGTVGPNTALSSEELGPMFDATGLGIDDLDSLRKSGLGLIKDLNIGKVSTEKGKKQLTAGVADITKSLNFLDLQQTGLQLKVLLEDSGMLDLIDALDSQDRALANNLRTLMTSAVTNNLRFSEQKVAVIEREGVGASNRKPGLVWDENTKTYYATDESYIDFLKGKTIRRGYLRGTDVEAERRIESLLNEKGLPLARSSDLVTEDISKAYKHREVIEVANRVLDRIRVEEVNEDVSAVEESVSPIEGRLEVLNFIKKGEGDYTSSNRGTKKVNGKEEIIGKQVQGTKRGGKLLTDMTIAEIKTYQKIKDPDNPNRLFAVGAYQFNPDTLDIAMKDAGFNNNTIFSEEVQDRMGLALLLGTKRPQLAAYIKGQSDDIETAMLEFAKEFASIPDPRTGKSFYADRGNVAKSTVEETKEALLRARENYASGITGEFVPREGEMNTLELQEVVEKAIGDTEVKPENKPLVESLNPQERP